MKLEDQVLSLNLAKRLKELKVKQDSLWSWYKYNKSISSEFHVILTDCDTLTYAKSIEIPGGSSFDYYSAFTVAELGELLPFGADSGLTDYGLHKKKSFFCAWRDSAYYQEKPDNIIFADTEANARAKMLIHLIENRLFKEGGE